jgi:hypothetical protein
MTQTQLLIRFLPVKFQISVTVDIFIASLYLSTAAPHEPFIRHLMSHSPFLSLSFCLRRWRDARAVGVAELAEQRVRL